MPFHSESPAHAIKSSSEARLEFQGESGKLRGLKRLREFITSRQAWALGAGIILALAFPKPGVAGLAWIAPALILLPAFGTTGKRTFGIGFLAGLGHHLTSLYWILLIPIPWYWAWAKVLGWMALGAFLALYMGLWVWLSWKIFPGIFVRPSIPHSPREEGEEQDGPAGETLAVSPRKGARWDFASWPERLLSVPWSLRLSWTLSAAALWVAMEMFIARVFGGFPWNLLGDSQYQMTPLIQIAGATGVYGVSFLIVWTSLSFMSAVLVIVRQPTRRSAWVGEIMLPMGTAVAIYLSGYLHMMHRAGEIPPPELNVALVQPSIPQTLIWDESDSDRRFQDLLKMTEKMLTNKVDLLIWPESAVPLMLRYYREMQEPIAAMATNHRIWMIIGSDDAEPLAHETNYFNSSFLISPEGKLAGYYRKQNLVIFGEYVPLAKWMPFLKWFTPISGGFTPGTEPADFRLGNLNVRTSVLICFEDVFPHLARKAVTDDTDFLVNITNDGWFGESAAQWQHAAAAVFRTVENGVPLIRCSNNGLTCLIDANGSIREILRDAKGRIYGEASMVVKVPLLGPGEKRAPTFYRSHGDVFGWACVGLAGLRLFGAVRRKVTPPGTITA